MKTTTTQQRDILVKILEIMGDYCLVEFSNGVILNVLTEHLYRTPRMKSERWRYSGLRENTRKTE